MEANTDLFDLLEGCIWCESRTYCSLATLRTLPKYILRIIIYHATEREKEIFYDLLSHCPCKSEEGSK